MISANPYFTAALAGIVPGSVGFGLLSDRDGRICVAQGYCILPIHRPITLGLGDKFNDIGMASNAEAWPVTTRVSSSSASCAGLRPPFSERRGAA